MIVQNNKKIILKIESIFKYKNIDSSDNNMHVNIINISVLIKFFLKLSESIFSILTN